MRVGIQIDTRSLSADMRRMSHNLSDLRPVFTKGGNLMRKSFADNFAAGGRPDHWVPLTQNTIASKGFNGLQQGSPYVTMRGRKRIGRLAQRGRRSVVNILIANGALRDSYATKNANHVSRVNLEGFEEGSKHFLAPFHEYGTGPYTIYPKRRRKLRFMTVRGFVMAGKVNHPGLPARPVAIYQEDDMDQIIDLLLERFDIE